MQGPWLRRLNSTSSSTRLFCFPSVGAGPSMFTELSSRMPDTVEMWGIALPGREARFQEPPSTELSELVTKIAEALLPYTDGRYALFGYCSGVLLAYLVARRIVDLGATEPGGLIVANYPPPHIRNHTAGELVTLESDAFWHKMIDLGEIPEQISRLADLQEIFEPAFRADYRILAEYNHHGESPLNFPITLVSGTHDPLRQQDLSGWELHSGSVTHEEIEASRWFLRDAVDELSHRLTRLLNSRDRTISAASETIIHTKGQPRNLIFLHDGSLAMRGALGALESAGGIFAVTPVQSILDVRPLLSKDARQVLVIGLTQTLDADFLTHLADLSQSVLVLAISRITNVDQLALLIGAGVHGYIDTDVEADLLLAALDLIARDRFFMSSPLRDGLFHFGAEQAGSRATSPAVGVMNGLTGRECQVLALVAEGWTHKEVGSRLGLSKATVDTYVQRIRQKLGLRNKAELTRAAMQHGIGLTGAPDRVC